MQDYLWLYSTLLTSPLVATLGLSLTIPLAIVADALFNTVNMNALFVTGSALVGLSFVGACALSPALCRLKYNLYNDPYDTPVLPPQPSTA